MKNQNTNFISLISKLLACVAIFFLCFYFSNNTEEVTTSSLLKLFGIGVGAFLVVYFVSFGIGISIQNLVAPQESEEEQAAKEQIKDGDTYYFYGDYHFGYSRVEEIRVLNAAKQEVKSKFAFANEEGEIVTKWFDGATEFEEPGVAVVLEDGRYNFLDNECNIILVSWPANIGEKINDNKLKVFWDDGTINFVDFKKKSLLWKDWKKSIG